MLLPLRATRHVLTCKLYNKYTYKIPAVNAPWLSWLQRPTVTVLRKCESASEYRESEGREFEPHWGSVWQRSVFFIWIYGIPA